MGDDESSRADIGSLLARVDTVPPVEALEAAQEEFATAWDARDLSVLLLDYTGRYVVRFTRSDTVTNGVGQDVVTLAGTVYERVLRSQEVDLAAFGGGVQVTVPVTVRGDTIGVMELRLPSSPGAGILADIRAVAHAIGYVIVANRRYTDLFECGSRTNPFTLAAEIQRRLLPGAFSCDTRQFSLAGWLEPASTVGGDTFDYAIDRDTLHLSITDAVGNDVNAAMLATVLVSSLRNGRRRGLDLAAQARYASDALAANSPVGHFVTGQLLRVDLWTGAVTIINAGHPFPLRLRAGQVEEIELDIDMPFGVYPDTSFTLQRTTLLPGDRLIMVTDGVLDRNSAHVDVPTVLGRTATSHPREVVRELSDAVIRATGGDLRDDSTVLCLDWHG